MKLVGKKGIKYSLVAITTVFALNGCSMINTNEPSEVKNQVPKTEQIKKFENKNSVERTINIKEGDSVKTIFERLSTIDNNIYIIENGSSFTSKISVNGIQNLSSLEKFFHANNYTLRSEPIEDTNYIRVSVEQTLSKAESKLSSSHVSLNGTVPVGDIIKMLSLKANIQPIFEDKTASNIALVNRNITFEGNALDAIKHVANVADLNVTFKENKVLLSYFRTETINIDIFTRDRQASTGISIEMKTSSDKNSTSSSSTSNSTSSSSTEKDLSMLYKTALIKDLEKSIDSVLSPQGSFTFMPTSGQVMVRDKNENVKLAQKLISDFNAQFKDTIDITLTFYKVTSEKGDKRGIDFKALGNKFDFSATSMTSTAFSGSSGNMFGLGYTGSKDSAVLNFLSEFGQAEVLNPITFQTQSNILKTLKVANNYGYISSTKTTTNTTTGTTGEATPASVADGSFISLLAKPIGNDFIAIDSYSTTTSLTRFNTHSTFGTTVQTPDTAEQSVDGYDQVKIGVPYILISHRYQESKLNEAGIPISKLDNVGLKADADKDVYIIVALEATIRK